MNTLKKILFLLFVPIIIIFNFGGTFKNTKSSYICIEKNSKRILKGENYNEQMLIASTVKILTAITTIENYSLDEEIIITKDDVNQIGSKVYFLENEKVKRIDLLYALMLRSANDAASALSKNNSSEFMYLMNETAKKIGMNSSVFENASGLDEREYNLSTAYDMALLTAYVTNNDIYNMIASSHSYKCNSNIREYNWINKHKLVRNEEEYNSGKTGYTKKSGRILVSSYVKEYMEIIIVSINVGNDWNFHKELVDSLEEYKFVCIYPRKIEEVYIDKKYYILIYNNVIIPIKDNEYDRISVNFILYENNAVMNIYLDNNLISKYSFIVKDKLNIEDYLI